VSCLAGMIDVRLGARFFNLTAVDAQFGRDRWCARKWPQRFSRLSKPAV